jgi:exodeoxyribonuclease-3
MRFTTWNVASLKARMPRVEPWLAAADCDVLCVQETKMTDEAFPADAFAAMGYQSVHHGEGRWNGVAILSRVGVEATTHGFGGLEDPYEGDARLVSAMCGGVRFIDLYVPNGREVPSEFYDRKLVWFERLAEYLEANHSPDEPLVLLGDFNVAPEDRDVWDITKFNLSTHVTGPERDALARLRAWGLTDAFRAVDDEANGFSFWDYRGGDFHQGRGMRIDLAYVTAPIAARLTAARVDRDARKGEKPSDHAPVIFDLAD